MHPKYFCWAEGKPIEGAADHLCCVSEGVSRLVQSATDLRNLLAEQSYGQSHREIMATGYEHCEHLADRLAGSLKQLSSVFAAARLAVCSLTGERSAAVDLDGQLSSSLHVAWTEKAITMARQIMSGGDSIIFPPNPNLTAFERSLLVGMIDFDTPNAHPDDQWIWNGPKSGVRLSVPLPSEACFAKYEPNYRAGAVAVEVPDVDRVLVDLEIELAQALSQQPPPINQTHEGLPPGGSSGEEASALSRMMVMLDDNHPRIIAIVDDKQLEADEKLRAIADIDRRFAGKTSDELGKLLRVSGAAIRKTRWWNQDRQQLLRE